MNKTVVIVSAMIIGGCARLDFGEEGLLYFEPKPYLMVSVDKECVATATVVSIPGEAKHVKFKSGFGSAALSVALSDGMLTNVGQTTDTKIPETITAILSVGPAGGEATDSPGSTNCPSAILYPIEQGEPNPDKGVTLFPPK